MTGARVRSSAVQVSEVALWWCFVRMEMQDEEDVDG